MSGSPSAPTARRPRHRLADHTRQVIGTALSATSRSAQPSLVEAAKALASRAVREASCVPAEYMDCSS